MLIRNTEQMLIESKKYTVSTVSGAYFHPLSLHSGLARGGVTRAPAVRY